MKNITPSFLILILLAFAGCTRQNQPEPASPKIELIQNFYKMYMNENRNQDLPFSKAFLADQKVDMDHCDKPEFRDEICNWNDDFDPYLNTQESEGLTFENSQFQITENPNNHVIAKFNVMPNFKDGKEPAYDITMEFILIQDGRDWVVDDFGPPGNLYRSRMYKEEI